MALPFKCIRLLLLHNDNTLSRIRMMSKRSGIIESIKGVSSYIGNALKLETYKCRYDFQVALGVKIQEIIKLHRNRVPAMQETS